MLNKVALANSLAVVTAVLYVLFALLAMIAPRAFQVLFDAQFFGANVASLFPKVQPSAASLVTLVLMVLHVMDRGLRMGVALQSVREDRMIHRVARGAPRSDGRAARSVPAALPGPEEPAAQLSTAIHAWSGVQSVTVAGLAHNPQMPRAALTMGFRRRA